LLVSSILLAGFLLPPRIQAQTFQVLAKSVPCPAVLLERERALSLLRTGNCGLPHVG
jgi:hypothetical protein